MQAQSPDEVRRQKTIQLLRKVKKIQKDQAALAYADAVAGFNDMNSALDGLHRLRQCEQSVANEGQRDFPGAHCALSWTGALSARVVAQKSNLATQAATMETRRAALQQAMVEADHLEKLS